LSNPTSDNPVGEGSSGNQASANTSLRDRSLGGLLRDWRRRRSMSQLDLACDADISTKHLSFLETGRSRPSRQMLLHLAACLDVPLRERNVLLSAAGFAPVFQERAFSAPALGLIRRNVEIVLQAHCPNPALAVDRHWVMLAANPAVAHLVAGADPTLLRPPVNVLRLSLHPAGLASRIVNLAQWRAHAIARLRRQIDVTGDGVLTDLLEELRDYPVPRGARPPEDESGMIAIPFQLATIDGVLSFFSTTTLFGTPVDITVSELAIEAFLPADTATTEIMRRLAHQEDTRSPDIHGGDIHAGDTDRGEAHLEDNRRQARHDDTGPASPEMARLGS
jgi:transcriptional regulator with XRE-family HTH domain